MHRADALPPSELLVSVRNAHEAELALVGGADLIDVKEPSRGPLGRADDATILAVVRQLAGRRPVSVALGEWLDASAPPPAGVQYVKWGLSGCGRRSDWSQRLARDIRELAGDCRAVAVAYADWRRAASPPPAEIAERARDIGCQAFLIDTFCKDGSTLLDWLTVPEIDALRQAAGLPLALAGSLEARHFAQLRAAQPTWFAVRGAACRAERDGPLDADKVRRLAEKCRVPSLKSGEACHDSVGRAEVR
jgi:uncharacterized protein (UPF0264 family)